MNDWFLRGDYGVTPTNYSTLAIALLLAFACGHAVARAYMFTHTGLSYSRSYVNTLILMPVIVALVMTVLAMMFYFWATGFGTRQRYDLILNLQWARPTADLPQLLQLLQRHSRAVQCASQRTNEGYQGIDLSYRLLLRDPARVQELLEELRGLSGVVRVSSVSAGDESEL